MQLIRSFTMIATGAALALTAACNGGGGESLSLDEYFRELDQLQNAGDERINGIPFPQVDPSAPVEDSRETFEGYFDEVVAAADDITSDISALDPPDEARDAHEEYVEALGGIEEFANNYRDRLAGADSPAELAEVLLGNDEDAAITERIDNSCVALQEIADDNAIDVDLECV
jgi:hypothetical protein